jgi:hypothetical protein
MAMPMTTQWDSFLRNLGTWYGTFASLDSHQNEVSRTSSILSLDKGDEERLVRFGLQRWDDSSLISSAAERGSPASSIQQDYRSLGRQVIFFPSGTFCKGTQQLAPCTAFGGEFGFIAGDRRHRLVILYSDRGRFERSILIREWREGSTFVEQPPLSLNSLAGQWRGEEATITANWLEPSFAACDLALDADALDHVRWLPDGGAFRVPEMVSHRQGFAVEAWWLSAPQTLERLIRRYDDSGAWQSVSQARLQRC